MATRRGANEGSVYWIEDRQCWAGSVDLGLIDGKRVRKVVKAKLKKDALAKMRAVQVTVAKGLPVVEATATTGDWLTWWAGEILPRTSVTATTVATYRSVLDSWVVPYVGRVPLAKLAPEHVEAMMRRLEDKGLSPRTIIHARAVLRRALAVAERRGKVARNAAALTEAPHGNASKLDDAMDASEASAVIQAASGDRLEALALLVLTVGLRRGEALALRWDDVDLEAGTVAVRKAKTPAGVRAIAVPGFVVVALRAHRARQAAERLASVYWHDPAVVFATPAGVELPMRDALRWWHGLTVRAGVGRRRFHASRHTAATLMLNAGVPLEVVSATLGHAGLAITADVYAKVRPALQRTAADAMEGLLGG